MATRKTMTSMMATTNKMRKDEKCLTITTFALLIILSYCCCLINCLPQSNDNNNNKERAVQFDDDPKQLINGAESTVDKRSPSRQYNFGLGKRSNRMERYRSELIDFLRNLKALRNVDGPIEFAVSDRIQPFMIGTFGEKRSKPQRFSFGLGKRSMEEVYDDGDDQMNVEQDLEKRKAQRYQFGIGKRSWFGESSNDDSIMGRKGANFEDFMKRRYSFGLGKRSQ